MDDRPPVPVGDPSRPGAPADLLSSGDDDRGTAGSALRRRLLATLAVLGVLAAGAVELREQPPPAVDLEVVEASAPDAATGFDGSRVTLALSVRLRNAGPAAVTVLSGGVADYGVVRPVELPAGQTSTVLLERQVRCATTPPPDTGGAATLALSVRAGSGPRRVELPVVLPAGGAAAACGFSSVEDGVVLGVPGSAELDEGVALSVDLTTGTTEPVTVLGARVDDGLDVVLRETDGTLLQLPRELPVPSAGSTVRLLIEAVVTVVDCRAARQVAAPVLRLSLSDDGGRVIEVSSDYDPGVVGSLVARSC